MNRVTSLEISGFKSIRSAKIDLCELNVLIGANGSGKSNLLDFFRMLGSMTSDAYNTYVAQQGGANSILYHGPKTTSVIVARLEFMIGTAPRRMSLRLAYGAPDRLTPVSLSTVGPTGDESVGEEKRTMTGGMLGFSRVFQFHDTSKTSKVRQAGYIEDNRYLNDEAGNLAAFLHRLFHTQEPYYRRIVAAIQQVTPFFADFDLAPSELNPRSILLNWREHNSDYLLGPHQLSDGTLRAMALIALLLQPEAELADVILIDEPELGLHPAALQLVASLLRRTSKHRQIIVATQSVPLVSAFKPEDVVVVERRDGGSIFERLNSTRLSEWLEEYTLGELWEKNVIGGRPTR